MCLEAVTVRAWRPYSTEFGDTLGSCNGVSLEIQLEAAIKRVWR